MIINHKNIETLRKEMCIHDTILVSFEFDYFNKRIEFKTYNDVIEKNSTIIIQCNNVIGFEVNCSDFWVPNGISIYDWDFVKEEEQVITKKLEKEINNHDNYNKLKPKVEEKFIETIMTLNSGDCIRIACENINFHDFNLIDNKQKEN